MAASHFAIDKPLDDITNETNDGVNQLKVVIRRSRT